MVDTPKIVHIGVDAKRALEVLSGSVFAGPDESIRELIVNAADSIGQLPAHLQFNLEIRLVPRFLANNERPGVLEVRDSGIGMTAQEAENYLGRLFASSKLNSSNVAGQFGVGFYSCFPLCSRVEVLTRSRNLNDAGTKVIYDGGNSLHIQPWPIEQLGTTVALHLRAEFRRLLERDSLVRLVRRYCDFIRYPIYVGEFGHDILNRLTAPWDRPASRENELIGDLAEVFGVKPPLAVFPLTDYQINYPKISGVLFVPQSEETHFFRLYSHRVLVNEQDHTLLDETLRPFFSGAIDVDDLSLVLSRNSIVQDAPHTRSVAKQLVNRIIEGFASLAQGRRSDFLRVMNVHGGAIKAACVENQSLFEKIADHIPFHSTKRSTVTIPEYLSERASVIDENTVIYTDNSVATAGILHLYEQAGIEVILMTDAADRLLRHKWPQRSPSFEFRPVEANPPQAVPSADQLNIAGINPIVVETVRNLFRTETRQTVQIKILALGEDGPVAVLALGEEERNRFSAFHQVLFLKQANRLNELPPEMQELANNGMLELMITATEQNLILNQSSEIVQELVKLVSPSRQNVVKFDSNLGSLLVQFLYGQALLCFGLPLTNEKIADISRNQAKLINALIQRAKSSE